MDDFFDLRTKTKYNAAYPAVFTACAAAIVYIAAIFIGNLADGANTVLTIVFSLSFCAYSVYRYCKSAKKSIAAVCAYLGGDMMLNAACGAHFSLIMGVIITFAFCLIMQKTELLVGYISVLIVSAMISLIFILSYEQYTTALKSLAGAIQGRGAAFGVLDNVASLLFGDYFEALFYYKAYSVTTAVDGKIITGAVDIFNVFDSPHKSSAEFLTGKFISTVFIPLGVFVSLFKRLKDEVVFAFFSALMLSVLFGDNRLFYLLLFLVSPLLYVGSMIVVYIGYSVCSFVDIRIGFSRMPDIITMFKNMHKPVYFLLIGAITAALSYFVSRLIAERFDLLSTTELPRDVKRLVTYLGGLDNIVKISDGLVTVSNPNLIDILHLDCDIRENTVELYPDDFDIICKIPN